MNLDAVLQRYRRRRTRYLLTTICIATLLAMLLRRPDQWWAPAVWIEEGTVALPDYVASGWASVFHPMMGYLVLPTKILLALAATISFRELPQIEYVLALLFSAAVLAAIAFAPTQLRWRGACALAVLALPLDSETYATSAYAFWWGSLLALLPLLWRDDARRHVLRSGLLLVGGLSSPLIIVLTPLYLLRAALRRNAVAVADAGLTLAAAATQALLLRQTAQAGNTAFESITPALFVRKFFGFFVDIPVPFGAHDWPTLLAGCALLGALGWCSIRYRRELGPAYLLLCGAFLLAALASVSRVPIAAIHPSLAGPRYFFLPFTLLSWIVVQVGALDARVPRTIALVTCALALRNTLDVGQRRHDPLDWHAAVDRCSAAAQFDLPVHWDGHAATAWKTPMSGADCRRLIAGSLFDNAVPDLGTRAR